MLIEVFKTTSSRNPKKNKKLIIFNLFTANYIKIFKLMLDVILLYKFSN